MSTEPTSDGRGELALTDDRHVVEINDSLAMVEERPENELEINGLAVLYENLDAPTVVRVIPGPQFSVKLLDIETGRIEDVIPANRAADMLGLVPAVQVS